MKVIRKKRLDYIRRTLSQKLPHTSIISHRVIWYSASLLLYGWFLSWIAYDIFVWHKLITQVSITNYVGAITAMALIWAGTKLFKTPKHVAQSPQPQTPEPENIKEPEKEKQHKKRKRQPQPQPIPQQQPQTPPQPQPQPKHTTLSIPGCNHNLGYLHQPGNAKQIPDECLICTQLLQCLATTNQ